MFDCNCNIYNYTRDEAEIIIESQFDKCVAIFRFSGVEEDEMIKDSNVTAVYAVTRKDLKNSISHYKVIVYNNMYALLHTDDGPCDYEKHTSLSKVLIGYSYL